MWYDSFVDFFGDYVPIVVSSSSVFYDGEIPSQPLVVTNWGYVLSVLLFGMVLYCLMRMLGGVLRRG